MAVNLMNSRLSMETHLSQVHVYQEFVIFFNSFLFNLGSLFALFLYICFLGFARIFGYPVGIIGNNGVLFSESAKKVRIY